MSFEVTFARAVEQIPHLESCPPLQNLEPMVYLYPAKKVLETDRTRGFHEEQKVGKYVRTFFWDTESRSWVDEVDRDGELVPISLLARVPRTATTAVMWHIDINQPQAQYFTVWHGTFLEEGETRREPGGSVRGHLELSGPSR